MSNEDDTLAALSRLDQLLAMSAGFAKGLVVSDELSRSELMDAVAIARLSVLRMREADDVPATAAQRVQRG